LDFGDRDIILTDPWFSEKTGYHYGEPLGMEIEALPNLGGVVVSHGHCDHWKVEVSEIEEAQHMGCMQPLVHILVHMADENPHPGSMGIIYQYCPHCKTATRVL
jgi:L-ascorbate metabolism protein UlaG (beta-lactamase superfamily)